MRTILLTAALAGLLSLPALAANPHVVLETTKGEIEIELFEDKAPISVKNFLQYVDDGFYDGTIFHRVISSFMIQGGGFTTDLEKKTTRAPITNEATNRVSNKRGTVAMARTGVVDSATAQFFINVVDNERLDHRGRDPRSFGYAVFGQVVRGMDVVDAIREVPTGRCGSFTRDCPQSQVVIKRARRGKADLVKEGAKDAVRSPTKGLIGAPKMKGKGGLKGGGW